ncbi:phage tail protein [Sphaerothrix gracilis]|uniref:phage tail protein n=1 Tax=Sphaerothrix gracilis TaxID=3151835 RepID=UPI0031FBB027
MTSSSQPRPTVSLDVISAEMPVAVDVVPFGTGSEQATTHLVLLPGKLGEFGVRLQNLGNQELQLTLKLKNNFPADWIYLNGAELDWRSPASPDVPWQTQPFVLSPKQTLQKNITFQVPADFFEEQAALVAQEALEQQYQGQLYLYASRPQTDREQLVGYQAVSFHVRPLCGYLDFLPEIYQQSEFLGRFLTIFEQAFDPTVQTLDTFWAYLDPLTAPKALLPFLAEWVAWPMNPRWKLKQQRRLIRHAVELYQWRGSRRGLQFALHLCTGLPLSEDHIQIKDAGEIEFTLGDVVLADEPTLGGGRSFHFSVVLRPATAEQAREIDEALVRSIIEQEKPAFCTYELEIVDGVD